MSDCDDCGALGQGYSHVPGGKWVCDDCLGWYLDNVIERQDGGALDD